MRRRLHSALLLPLVGALVLAFGCGSRRNVQDDPERPGTMNLDQVFEHDGKERAYHFYVPADVSEPRPLVLTLHGGGGTIDNHIGVGRADWPQRVWLDIADEENLYVLVPQGINQQWNDCRVECERCGDEDDIGFLLGLIDQLQRDHNIDASRVYVSGESNGGMMTQRLVQEAPERFAAAGATIALRPENSDCVDNALPTPFMYQLGTEDALMPYEGGSENAQIVVQSAVDSVAYWRELNQCEQTPTLTDYDDLDPDDDSTAHREDYACPATGTAVSLVTLRGAGHVASSIEVQVSALWEGIAGEQNHDVEAMRLYWAFMRDFTREQRD
jgi:polyhydroxybutyrate depolymerase